MSNKVITKEEFLERIAHMITGSNIPNEVFERYFANTQIGYMTYCDFMKFLEIENEEE